MDLHLDLLLLLLHLEGGGQGGHGIGSGIGTGIGAGIAGIADINGWRVAGGSGCSGGGGSDGCRGGCGVGHGLGLGCATGRTCELCGLRIRLLGLLLLLLLGLLIQIETHILTVSSTPVDLDGGLGGLLLAQLLTVRIQLGHAIGAQVHLDHERLHDAFVLHRLGGQDDGEQLAGRDAAQVEVARQPLHDALELELRVLVRMILQLAHLVLGPRQHRLELADLRRLQLAAHDHLDHRLGQVQELRALEQRVRLALHERQYHVDQLGGGCVAPVVVLQRDQHRTDDLNSQELLAVVEAGLQQLRQVVVLGGAKEA